MLRPDPTSTARQLLGLCALGVLFGLWTIGTDPSPPVTAQGEPPVETPTGADAGDGEPADGPTPTGPTPTADPDATPQLVEIAARSPLGFLLPDSELVFGPSAFGFDVEERVADAGGFLNSHLELVDGALMTGPDIVERVALEHSVGPRTLLALLELEAGWVRSASPGRFEDPLRVGTDGLYASLSEVARQLNLGYYQRRLDGASVIPLAGGEGVAVPSGNAGSWAMLRWLSRDVPAETWAGLERPSRFWGTWTTLYGFDPLFANSVPVRSTDDAPELDMSLPFERGRTWYFVEGPHPPRGEGTPDAAVSFAPSPAAASGCFGSVEWVTAVTSGRVAWSTDVGVLVDPNLDRDNYVHSGWSILYRHLSPIDRVAQGTRLAAGDRIGHPSCEPGTEPTGQTRVSVARRYDGAWVPASDPQRPMVLDGWLVLSAPGAVAGRLARPGFNDRRAQASKVDAINGITAGAP